MKTIEEIRVKMMSLSNKEKASLAHSLIQSLDNKVDTDVEEAWDSEVQSRMDKFKSGQTSQKPAFDVLDQIKSKHQ